MTAPAYWIAALHDARAAERAQVLFYRVLAARAEDAGDAALAERLNELHADEQHHLSRLSARLLELGETLALLAEAGGRDAPPLAQWEDAARRREHDEVARYEALLAAGPDEPTAALLTEMLAAERAHARELRGKWMGA